jgi:hypothetical protein
MLLWAAKHHWASARGEDNKAREAERHSLALSLPRSGPAPYGSLIANSRPRGELMECLSFATREAFVAWLAAENDALLSGRHLPRVWLHDNQRLTLRRLQQFIS